MKNRKIYIVFIVAILILISVILSQYILNIDNNIDAIDIITIDDNTLDNKETYHEELVISEENDYFLINNQKVDSPIEMYEDSNLEVLVTNNTNYEISIHFHGVLLSNSQDGVAGVTQESIKPGESFVYKMYIKNPGTYMYHSHIDTANQIQNEYLYGQLIVKDNDYKDYKYYNAMYSTELENIDAHHNASYTFDEITVNGKNEEEYKVDNKKNIIYSVVNISSVPLIVDLGPNITYSIVNVDGNETKSTNIKNESLIIPTAQRVEIMIEKPETSFQIRTYSYNDNVDSVVSNFIIDNSPVEDFEYTIPLHLYDTNFETINTKNLKNEDVDIISSFDLSMANGGWGINNETFPDTSPIEVSTGDIVELTLTNSGHMGETHPFHLHGHTFEVMSINGVEQNNMTLDTIEVPSGYEIVIRIEADNPGLWLFHCHDLTHAEKGMVTMFNYEGYYTSINEEIHG